MLFLPPSQLKLMHPLDPHTTAITNNRNVFLVDSTQRHMPNPPNSVMGARIERIHAQNNAAVECVAFSPCGEQFATACRDNTTKIWRLSDGVCSVTLEGHTDYVVALAFSPNGKLLATGSSDGTAKFWRFSDGLCTTTFCGHTNSVTSVAFGLDGALLATGSSDGTAKLWCLGVCTATLLGHYDAVWTVAFSPDSKFLATAGPDKTTKLWRLKDNACTKTLAGHAEAVTSVAFSPDGLLLASGSSDKTVKLWRVADGTCTATFMEQHAQVILSVAFSRDGKIIVTGSSDGNAKLWRVSDGMCTATLAGHADSLLSVAFSPDGLLLATGGYDATTIFWRVADGVCTSTVLGHVDAVLSVAFSPDGMRFATGSSDNTASIWSVSDGKCLLTLVEHTSAVVSVAFSPDGLLIVTASHDNTAKIWRVSNGTCIATLEHNDMSSVSSATFSPDGAFIATGSGDNSARLWRLSDGTCIATLIGHTSSVSSVAFSPDGALIATGSEDNSAKLWRVSGGTCIATLIGHTSSVSSVAFSPHRSLVATGSNDGTVMLWNVSGGTRTKVLVGHNNPVSAVAFSPDGMHVATGSWDSTIKAWRVEDGSCATTFSGHAATVSSIAFSPDGTLFVTGSFDNTAKLWRASEGVCKAVLQEHTGSVLSIGYGPGGTLLATGSSDRTAKLWRTSDAGCVRTLSGHTGAVLSVAFSPDEVVVATSSDDSTLKIWRASDGVCLGTRNGAAFCPNGRIVSVVTNEVTEAVFRVDVGVCTTGMAGEEEEESTAIIAFVVQTATPPTIARSVPGMHHRVRKSALHIREPAFAFGSTCAVYRALLGDVEYALKLYHPNVSNEIARELAVAPYLYHSNIVRVERLVEEEDQRGDGTPKIVGLLLEMCETSLEQILRREPVPVPLRTRVKWLRDIAVAASFAHMRRVLHSDIKPDNVLIAVDAVSGERVAKLTDFGSSFVLSTAANVTVAAARGTPMFVAPEYAAGDTGPTTAADVFSLGLTMWCAVFPGVDHGLGTRDVQIIRSLDRGVRPPTDGGVPLLVDLIERCWAVDPPSRPTMDEVALTLGNVLSSLPETSTLLWEKYLHPCGLVQPLRLLTWNVRDAVHYSDPITDTAHPCHAFVCSRAGAGFDVNRVSRVVMTGRGTTAMASFVDLHEAEAISRAKNAALRVDNPMDGASVAGLRRLQEAFADVHSNGDASKSRIVLAWHGTAAENVERVCRDGPRSLRTTDAGYFGAGSYFALEAAYAAGYSTAAAPNLERAVILFAVSVSQVKVVTPELDYRRNEDPATPHLHGFSRFYSGDPNTAVALTPRCDAHFIPVKYSGHVHPLTGQPTPRDVHFQAVDEGSGTAEGHELVLLTHQRCTPLAVVYFTV